jgi:Tol biopolymer transport system component
MFRYASLLLICSLLACRTTSVTAPPKPFKLVFLSNREAPAGEFDIFLMNSDGSGQTNLTANLSTVRTHSRPVLSPDQAEILFLAFVDSKTFLQILTIATGAVATVTEVPSDIAEASFSPDGRTILFIMKIFEQRQVHTINRDGTGLRNLSLENRDEFNPVFSPDGETVCAVSRDAASHSLVIINCRNGERNIIHTTTQTLRDPAFAADGRSIVFCGGTNANAAVQVVDRSGENLHVVHSGAFYATHPHFSPDGSQIAFISNQRGMKYQDIFIMDRRGRQAILLTAELKYINQDIHFSPDGRAIVFSSMKFNDSEICRIDLQDRSVVNLTNHPKWDQSPGI